MQTAQIIPFYDDSKLPEPDRGYFPPDAYVKSVQLKLPNYIKRALFHRAVRSEVSYSQMARAYIDSWLDHPDFSVVRDRKQRPLRSLTDDSAHIVLRLEQSMFNKLYKIAKKQRTTMSFLLNIILEKKLIPLMNEDEWLNRHS